MPSLETRVILGSLLSVLIAFALFVFVESTVGFPAEWSTLAGFLIIVGLGIGAPQLYLASTDRSVPATSRFGFLIVVLFLFGPIAVQTATRAEQIAILVLTGVVILLVVVFQFRAGYKQSTTAGDS